MTWLWSLLRSPRITVVEDVDGVRIPGGRSPVRVLVEGWGRVRIGPEVRWVSDGWETMALVPVGDQLSVSCRNVFGGASVNHSVKASTGDVPRLVVPTRPAVDLRLETARLRSRPLVWVGGVRAAVPGPTLRMDPRVGAVRSRIRVRGPRVQVPHSLLLSQGDSS